MAKYDVSVNGNQLVVTLVISGGDFESNVRTFRSPSTKLVKQGIKLMESGIYKMTLTFSQINEIGGVIPSDLTEANDLVNELIGTGTATSYNFDLTSPNWTSEGVTDKTSFINWLETRSYDFNNDLINVVVTDFNFEGNRIKCNMTADGTTYELSALGLTNADKIGIVTGLKILNLEDNELTEYIIDTNHNLLEYFAVPYNNLTHFELPPSLITLKSFYVNNNNLTEFIFPPTLNKVEQFSVASNNISDFVIPTEANLLEFIRFNNNPLSDITIPSTLINTKIIQASDTLLNFINIPDSLVNLRGLVLENCLFTTSSYTAMEVWANTLPIYTLVDKLQVNLSGNIDSVSETNFETILLTKNAIIIP